MDDATTTYAELDEASARVAGMLRQRGFKPGDRVGIMQPNVAEFAVTYYGVLRAGGVVVPMNPLLKRREVAYYLGDSGAGLIFAWHEFADEARGGAEHADAEAVVVDPAELRRSPGLRRPGPRDRRPGRRATPRCSCIPPARPASRRAPSSPTPTSPATPRWCVPTSSARARRT